MHLTQTQEKFYDDVKATVIAFGGMETKYSSYPLTINTQAGILRIKPYFDGVYLLFESPAKALALNVPCHRNKGTLSLETPPGASNEDYSKVLEQLKALVQPLLNWS